MTDQDLKELLELERKFNHKLNEALSVTTELAEAVSRQDHVSLRVLISMRQKPLLELQEISSYIDLKRMELSQADAQEFTHLLSGKPAEHPEEVPVADQIAANHRLAERLSELDRRVSYALCGEGSFYEKCSP